MPDAYLLTSHSDHIHPILGTQPPPPRYAIAKQSRGKGAAHEISYPSSSPILGLVINQQQTGGTGFSCAWRV